MIIRKWYDRNQCLCGRSMLRHHRRAPSKHSVTFHRQPLPYRVLCFLKVDKTAVEALILYISQQFVSGWIFLVPCIPPLCNKSYLTFWKDISCAIMTITFPAFDSSCTSVVPAIVFLCVNRGYNWSFQILRRVRECLYNNISVPSWKRIVPHYNHLDSKNRFITGYWFQDRANQLKLILTIIMP